MASVCLLVTRLCAASKASTFLSLCMALSHRRPNLQPYQMLNSLGNTRERLQLKIGLSYAPEYYIRILLSLLSRNNEEIKDNTALRALSAQQVWMDLSQYM